MNKMLLLTTIVLGVCSSGTAVEKPRVIVTSDGEIDDECSMVRFLLYANEWDIEGVITSSSQYHWQGHRWGGRYVRVRENTWLDPVPVAGYVYPEGRWYGSSAWGRNSFAQQRREYFKPMWRWTAAMQNDFAARADWCVKPYKEANHPPAVKLAHAHEVKVRPGESVSLSARGTTDPDGDELTFHWWRYREAGSYDGTIEIRDAATRDASFVVPGDVGAGKTIHMICEVTDAGTPPLTRYQRVVLTVRD